MKPSKPKLSEAAITKQIRDYLDVKKIFHVKHWSGPMSHKGIPDIIGVLPGGKALLIEIKREGGKVSEEQKSFLENARELGAKAFIARCVEDLMKEGL